MKLGRTGQRMLGLAAFFGAVCGSVCAQPAGLWSEATLYRDDYGTPHIQATTVRGLAFGFGYAQAEDHLEPMLMAYRIALGRAAEVAGESYAESDAFSIKISNAEQSSIAMERADPITRDLCEGFALGINAWILSHQDRVPDWAEGVQPKDVLAWWHYLMVAQAPFDLPGAFHPKAPLERANAWALAPGNTVEGAALLVMNPHQYFDGPYRWYEAHLMLGDMNLAGATLRGLPVLMMGHNQHGGWALTPNQADTADFFQEHLSGPEKAANDPRMPSAINDIAPLLSFMATAKPYYVRTATGLVERAVPSYIGTRGPIFEGGNGALYSWRNGAFQQFGGLRQLFLMGQATGVAAMKEALAMHQLPSFQVICVDREGNLFYRYNARLGNKDSAVAVKERQAVNWAMPVDSGREMFAWGEIIGPGRLPAIENPASGYVQACGTPPWLATAKSGLQAADWPAWLAPEPPNYRAFRVNQILSAGRYSAADMQAMLYDTFVPAAADMVPLLLAMADARPELIRTAHPDLVTALRLLQGWNLSADRESPAMAYYSIWWALMKKRHLAQFGGEAGLYQGLLANTAAAQAQALDAAVEAARIMRNDFNGLSIPWGNLHRLHRGVRNEAAPGTDTGDPIFFLDNQAFVNRQWHANFGTGFAMVVQFGERTRAASVVPFGASDQPDSPHFADQMNLFLSRGMKRTRFLPGSVIQHATRGRGTRIALGRPGLDGYCAVSAAQPIEARLEAIETAPGPLPSGLVAFTPPIRPQVTESVPWTWELDLAVGEAQCAPENLTKLQIHTHTLEEGWRPLLGGRYDSATSSFRGQGGGSPIVAVLGPADVLKADGAPVDEAADSAEAPAAPDEFLRAPMPAPEMEGPAEADETPEGETVEGGPSGIAATEATPDGGAPEVTAPTQPEQKLFDVEFMEQPDQSGVAGIDPTIPEEELTKEQRKALRKARKAQEEAEEKARKAQEQALRGATQANEAGQGVVEQPETRRGEVRSRSRARTNFN